MADSDSKSHKKQPYENNPFTLAVNGLNLIFDRARNVAILLLIFSIVSVFSGMIGNRPTAPSSRQAPADMAKQFQDQIAAVTPAQWVTIVIIILILAVTALCIIGMINGMSAYSSARVARGHKVGLGEAFHEVLDHFFSFLWLQIITVVKVFLWSLLFIIPGIVMAVRYSLANIAFFDKGLRGNAAIKESLRLTRGGWLTTYASTSLFNMLTAGVISELIDAGAKTILYRQFTASNEKPAAHWLSWATLFLPLALVLLFLMFVVIFVTVVALTGTSLQ